METKDAIMTRRSIRKYENKSVPHELIEAVIGEAAYAPSWKNFQISRYLVIESEELKNKISEKYVTHANNSRMIKEAPVLIVQTFVKNSSGYNEDGSFSTDRKDGWQYYDCGLAAQTLCLSAHNHGLGTIILGIFDISPLQSYLQIPEDQEIMALIPMGYAAESPKAPKRKTADELITYFFL